MYGKTLTENQINFISLTRLCIFIVYGDCAALRDGLLKFLSTSIREGILIKLRRFPFFRHVIHSHICNAFFDSGAAHKNVAKKNARFSLWTNFFTFLSVIMSAASVAFSLGTHKFFQLHFHTVQHHWKEITFVYI